MTSRLLLLVFVAVAAACDAAPERAITEPAMHEPAAVEPDLGELRALLRAPDVVIDDEHLSAIAEPEALVTAFEALLADGATSSYERTRIVSALRLVEIPRAEALLASILNEPTTSIFVRRVAIKAYAARAQVRGLPLLTRFASHDDRHTREATLRALGRIDAPEARALLQERARREPAADLRGLARRLASP